MEPRLPLESGSSEARSTSDWQKCDGSRAKVASFNKRKDAIYDLFGVDIAFGRRPKQNNSEMSGRAHNLFLWPQHGERT